jgi:hypothetical protein
MSDVDFTPRDDLDPTDFSPKTMDETWDLSNVSYNEILERQRLIEDARLRELEDRLRQRSLIQKILDNLVPAR